MATLSQVLAEAEFRAKYGRWHWAREELPGGLMIIIDYSDPTFRQVRFRRRAPAWPSSSDIELCRKTIQIPEDATLIGGTRFGVNEIAYRWPQPERKR